ncbi:zinc-binding dehydrogenase [Streptomyces sp. NBC_00243]|uniref:zinc-dependent alcohol dehydrogenase n=1 Tax=Streptomyces sp. NBC_00243 TaxID=2975688 RepID=UPI002DDA37B8|nr:zinc-binding dehydrogenase [Streptomyces sp. NBC_00243]WRZ17357.1 zinc-binding dehydrogenase [Streptomyces sp. NBC_00243]
MNQALEFYRSPAKYLAVRGATSTRLGSRFAGALAGNVAPLRLVTRQGPSHPGPGWVRLRPLLSGICGSDLALLTGRSSPYLGPLVSLPFVPGHEIVAETVDEAPGLPKGSRVVVDPVLSCAARELPPCAQCRSQRHSRCDHITSGSIASGLQTGFCSDTGGGWSHSMTAHPSQLHAIPDSLDDRVAVLVEPLACAIHSVRRTHIPDGAAVLIVGAGTVGLLTLLALREFSTAGPVYVIAKHEHQRERAKTLGATEVLGPKQPARALRSATSGFLESPEFGSEYLLGGVDVAFECTGSASALDSALRMVRAGGTVVLSGMPSGSVDLTPVWFRELRLAGSYASDGPALDFAESIDVAARAPLSGYVDAVYPLSRWRDALGHAASSGRLGTVKVAFDPTRD